MSHDDEASMILKYLPLARRIAARVQPLADADEILSAAQVALVQCFRDFKPGCGASLATYLNASLRFRVIDALRESGVIFRRGRQRLPGSEVLDEGVAEPQRYEWGLDRRDQFDWMILPLSQAQRSVLVGCYRDNRTLREIASELGCTASFCSVLHKQALEFLRYRLGAQQSA